jgi:hypothetical protein
MMHTAMRMLPAQATADTGEIVFVRRFPVHIAVVFLAQKCCYYMQHYALESCRMGAGSNPVQGSVEIILQHPW